MDDCKIVTDLLPGYCDELTAEETNAYIHSHLSSCPDCGRRLEQMRQAKAADARRAESKAREAECGAKHRIRVQLIAVACLMLIALFFVFRAFSFDIAIAASGLNRRLLKVAQEPTRDYDGKEFQIVFSQNENDEGALAYLEKNALGFWVLKTVNTAVPDKAGGAARMYWNEYIYSSYGGKPGIDVVCHEIVAGCNAVDSFERLPQDQIPGNVAVIVNQNANSYYIHVITVLTGDGSAFDVCPLLKENNLIS